VLGNKQNRLEKITKPSFLFFCDPFVKWKNKVHSYRCLPFMPHAPSR
jgi:hypothetical protein